MKLLMLTSRFGSGYGMGYSAYKEASALVELGHSVTVIHCNSDIANYRDPQITFIHAPINSIPLINFVLLNQTLNKIFNEKIAEGKFDAVYIQSLEFGVMRLSRVKIPIFYFARSTMIGLWNVLRKEKNGTSLPEKIVHDYLVFLEHKCMNDSHIVFVKSHTMASEVTRCYGINPEKIAIVAGGIDEKDFRVETESSGAEFRKNLGIPLDAYTVLYAGRIVPQKGLIYLIKAALRLVDKYKLTVVVAGAPTNKPYTASIDPLVKNSAHRDSFCFLGHVDQMKMSRVFASADCLVTPSLYEPFGMVNLQAASMGKTVITTDVTGSIDVLAGNPRVKIVPAGSVDSLEAALREVLSWKRRNQSPVDFKAYSWRKVAEQLTRYFSLYGLKRSA